MNRRGNVQPAKPKKQGFFGEEEDLDPSLFFNNPSLYRQENTMIGSPTPSQLSSFGASLYGPSSRAVSGLGLPQRGLPNQQYPVPSTPTSNIGMGSGFSLGLQQQQSNQVSRTQQVSPNSVSRGVFNVGQQSILSQLTSQTNNLNQMKQSNALTSGLLGSSTLNNIGTFPRQLNDGSQSGASFDWSEFPMLGNRNSAQNQIMTSRNYVNMVNKQDPTPEFQIQQEDFPALPGAQNPATTNTNESNKPLSSMGSYDQAVKDSSKAYGDKMIGLQRKGIQTTSDGTITNIPSGMLTDQFGMVGLLTFIRTAENDPSLVALAPGIDLTTLGLNLNQPDNLFPTFQSPWSDLPCRPQDIDYNVPPEYLTNVYVRDKLAPIRLNRYHEDLLFYLFYVNGGDLLQLAAAAELYNRDWRYHKEERVWITRAPGMEPLAKTNTYERGTYFFFDVHSWRKVPKEFYLEYNKLEERPQLPDGLSNNKA